MNSKRLLGICLFVLLLAGFAGAQSNVWHSELFAYCVEMGAPGGKPHSMPEQMKILKETGFDGVGYGMWLGDDMEKNLKMADDVGLKLYMFWANVNVSQEKGKAYDQRLPDAIRKLKGRSAVVAVLLGGFKPGDPQGMEPAVKILRELGDVAAEAGVRISIYNHVGNWTESLPFIVEVVKKVNHPQVGFSFNLCHWLKVDGEKDYRPLLRQNAAKLFCVTINGAQIGAKGWTNGLIQPLDKGDFDNRPLLITLDEIGYRGPVGLMCYGIPDELREHLARSMAVWRKLNGHILHSL